MAKRLNPNRKTANQGVAFVQGIADEMGCVWRPTPNDDVGLDGEIELGKDGTATGLLLKVQVKSGRSYFHNPTGSSFEFLANPNDLKYWSEANLPVILVVYDPDRREGYWKAIREYLLHHPGSITKTRRISFSRRRDRFVVASFMQLCNLVFPDEAELTNFLKNKITEPLYSNLLPVVEYPETLYHFQLSESRLAEMSFEESIFPREFVPHGNGYIGFRDPRQPGSKISSAVLSNTVESERSSLDFLNGRGRVFRSDGQVLGQYPEAPSGEWVPSQAFTKLHLFSEVTLMTGEWLEAFYAKVPGMDNLSPEQIDFVAKSSAGIRKLHASIIGSRQEPNRIRNWSRATQIVRRHDSYLISRSWFPLARRAARWWSLA